MILILRYPIDSVERRNTQSFLPWLLLSYSIAPCNSFPQENPCLPTRFPPSTCLPDRENGMLEGIVFCSFFLAEMGEGGVLG